MAVKSTEKSKRVAKPVEREQVPGARKITLAKQIAQDLASQIASGELAPGDQLPWREDLCRQYGVSLITVSGALSDLTSRGLIESRWRSGIFVKKKSELGSLELGNTIALVAEVATNMFIAPILSGATESAARAGYHVVLTPTGDDPDVEAKRIDEFADKVSATLVVPVNHTASHASAFARLTARERKLIFIDHYIEGINAPHVTSDNVTGGYIATKHLLESGCRRVYAVNVGRNTSSRERILGYIHAIEESGGLYDPALVISSAASNPLQCATDLTRKILDSEPNGGRFGIFAINDAIAAGCYVAIKEAGRKIPNDVAIVAFDDPYAPMMDPPLTSIRQDLIGMGRTAVDMFVRMMKGEEVESMVLPVELVVRASSG